MFCILIQYDKDSVSYLSIFVTWSQSSVIKDGTSERWMYYTWICYCK